MSIDEQFERKISRTISQLRIELLRTDKTDDERVALMELLEFFQDYADSMDGLLLILERKDMREFRKGQKLFLHLSECNRSAGQKLLEVVNGQGLQDQFEFWFADVSNQ
jgi:hypothetical protein